VPRYLLDTSAVLAHYRNEPGASRVQEMIEEEGSQILIATPTLVEFRRRMKELGATARLIDDAISAYEEMADGIVSIDKAAAEAAWQLSRSSGRRLPLVDSLIAGAARAASAVLVHRDPRMAAIPPHLLTQTQLGSRT
jgi:predicted nucleic acid-binding protein